MLANGLRRKRLFRIEISSIAMSAFFCYPYDRHLIGLYLLAVNLKIYRKTSFLDSRKNGP